MTAWIDGSDLIRRLALEGDDYTLTMEFSEFGTPVEARPPVPANLRELEDVLNELLANA